MPGKFQERLSKSYAPHGEEVQRKPILQPGESGTLGNIRRDWCSEGWSRPLIEDLKSDCRTLPAVPRDNALLMI